MYFAKVDSFQDWDNGIVKYITDHPRKLKSNRIFRTIWIFECIVSPEGIELGLFALRRSQIGIVGLAGFEPELRALGRARVSVVPPGRFELPTFRLEGDRSIP